MTEALGAEKGERTPARLGHRNGYYVRTLVRRSTSWNCACPRTATAGSRPSCSSASNVSEKTLVGAGGDVRAGRLDPQELPLLLVDELARHAVDVVATGA
jgi:putative transposase